MESFLPEIASAMSEVQIGALFRFAEMVPEAAITLVIAVMAAVVGLVHFDVNSQNLLPR